MNLGMGLLPDDRKAEGIIGDLSVRENIILALQAKRGIFKLLPMSKQIEIADKYIELLQIKTANRETLIKQLSGGNQQKVILARWLATDPEFLILDEPTTGLDPIMQNKFVELIKREKDAGKTILMSSHIFEEVENSPVMQKLWESYRRKFSYAADLEWSIIMGAVRSLYALCEKGSSL